MVRETRRGSDEAAAEVVAGPDTWSLLEAVASARWLFVIRVNWTCARPSLLVWSKDLADVVLGAVCRIQVATAVDEVFEFLF